MFLRRQSLPQLPNRAGAYRRFFWKIYAVHMDAAAYAQQFIIQLFRLKRFYKRLQLR